MENLILKIKKNDGYISIETIIVCGLIISLGVVSIQNFNHSADYLNGKSINSVLKVQQSI